MKMKLKMLSPAQTKKLEIMQKRAEHTVLFGKAPDGEPWSKYLANHLKETLEWAKDPDIDPEVVVKKYRRAYDGDMDAREELRTLRIEQTQNYVIPVLNFGQFFEVITLGPNEAPFIQNNTKQEFTATYIAQDGDTQTRKVTKDQYETQVDLRLLTTDEVEYMLKDIYTGDLTAAAQVNFDLDFDLRNQLDGLLQTLALGSSSLGTFDITNANKARRAYKTNSRLLSGVLPTTNDLQITGIGGSTKFSPVTLDEAMDYCARFAGMSPDGDLAPTGKILIPSQDLREISSGYTFTGAKQNEKIEEIADMGWYSFGYLGKQWTLQPDNTIARKACIPQMNKPLGWLWLKPSMDDEEETVLKRKNLARRWKRMCVAMATTEPRRKNFIRVAYRT